MADNAFAKHLQALQWLLSHNSLLFQSSCAHVDWCLPFCELEQIDNIEDKLAHWFATSAPTRLGHYAEQLMQFVFHYHPRYQVILAHYPIRQQTKTGVHTLGEIDFIIKDKITQSTLHIEMAVKFYCGVQDANNHWHWLGPNLQDTLQDKTTKLFTHQLPLGQTAYGEPIDASIAWMPGTLFLPIENASPKSQAIANTKLDAGDHAHMHMPSEWGVWGTLSQCQEQGIKTLHIAKPVDWLHLSVTTAEPIAIADIDLSRPQQGLGLLGGQWKRVFLMPDTWLMQACNLIA